MADKTKKQSLNKKPLIFSVIFVLILILFTLIIKKSVNQNLETLPIDTKNSIKTNSQDGELFVDNIPNDLPVYPNSSLKEFSKTEDNKSTITMIFEAVAKSWEVDQYFEENLKKNSWDINQRVEKDGSYTLSFMKGGRKGIIGITGSGGESVIILITVDK